MPMTAAWLICLLLAVPVATLAVELLVGSVASKPSGSEAGIAPPFAVLIPAHDEALGIAATLDAVRGRLRPCDRLLVVADHCTDATAATARRCGAEVIERDRSTARGKAYALGFGRDHLRRDPRAVVLLLDADCRPVRDALHRLAAEAARNGAATQGAYLLSPASDAGPIVRISSFAFLLKNLVRQRGLSRLSGLALLQGSGMAMPWAVFDAAPIESPSLVEDLELGLNLLLAGQAVRFAPQARFLSPAGSQAATVGQRRRWEHGTLSTMRSHAPRLVAAGATRRPALLWVAADLCVPPVTLLIPAASIALLSVALLSGFSEPTLVLTFALALLGLGLWAAWRSEGRATLPAAMLARLPLYLFWKLPILLQFLTRRERDWVRTSREP